MFKIGDICQWTRHGALPWNIFVVVLQMQHLSVHVVVVSSNTEFFPVFKKLWLIENEIEKVKVTTNV